MSKNELIFIRGGETRSEDWYLRPDDIRDLQRELVLCAEQRARSLAARRNPDAGRHLL